MCLTKTKRLPRIAIKDIVVYKVLLEVDGNLLTPYREYPIEMGKTYIGSFVDCYVNAPHLLYKSYFLYKIYHYICSIFSKDITGGYIHSYYNKLTADYSSRVCRCLFPTYIVKCTIPKGSIYFIGENGYECASIKLRYDEIVSYYPLE